MAYPGSKSQAGLTLIELLVVTVLLALISLIVSGSLASIIKARDAIQSQQLSYQIGRATLRRIEHELGSRVLAPLSISPGSSETGVPTGQFYFLGQSKRDGENSRDRLVFLTEVGAQGQSGGFENHGRVEIEYRLEEKKGMTSAADTETYYLVREERPYGLKEKTAIADRTHREVLADNMVGLGFRYFSDKRWRNDWADPRPRLPDAVEVTLTFLNPDLSKTTFRTAYCLVLENQPGI